MEKRRSCTVKNLPASVLDAAAKRRPLIARINGSFALFLLPYTWDLGIGMSAKIGSHQLLLVFIFFNPLRNLRIYLHLHRHLILQFTITMARGMNMQSSSVEPPPVRARISPPSDSSSSPSHSRELSH
ncbi:hypothetical protein E3N88_01828 [Mikania micrantha]|uniref:Uncharacterized protein n=1 Tax=Mikania micrantha TaxID=192012 RepID=A0A5N6Q2B1_9ASTR|nr:hypothetical protein E3N88_01828 [Mikania micrantha]